MRTTFISLLAIASQLHGVESFWRMICDRAIVTARIDPIISPGAISAHTHSITGASGVDYGATYDDLRNSKCTTCQVTQDLSAYWVPQLYYVHENGTYESVDLVTGITVYYLSRGEAGPAGKVLAAPAGLKMIAGDPFRRSYNSSSVEDRAIGFSCLGGSQPNYNQLSDISNCPNGLRQEIFFPNCWDGVNLDSADHASHMAYSGDSGNGACPSTHPVKIVSLFYEVMWGIDYWKNSWWNGTSPPFVFAQGDPTGYGSHADFMMGWDEAFLQEALDTCTSSTGLIQDCPIFNIDYGAPSQCEWEGTLLTTENVKGTGGGLATLPGCNPVTWGPDEAPVHPAVCPDGSANSNAVVSIPSSSEATLPTPLAAVAKAGIQAAGSALVAALPFSLAGSASVAPSAASSVVTRSHSSFRFFSNATTRSTATSATLSPDDVLTTTATSVVLSQSTVTLGSSGANSGSDSDSTNGASTNGALVDSGSNAVAAQKAAPNSAASAVSSPAASGAANVAQANVGNVAQAASGSSSGDSKGDAIVDADDNAAAVAATAATGSTSTLGGNVANAAGAVEIDYITITTTLYESASPYVQLYVIPSTVGLSLQAAQQATATQNAGRTTITSTVYETLAPSSDGKYASMDAVNALPSMGIFSNTTRPMNSSLTTNSTSQTNGTALTSTQFVTTTLYVTASV